MSHYICTAPVLGTLGPNCHLDRTANPPQLTKFEYVLHTAPDNQDLIASRSSRDYLVSDRLAHAILREQFTGVQFGEMNIVFSRELKAHHPLLRMPLHAYSWMKITGSHLESDFSLLCNRMVVSYHVRQFLAQFSTADCRFTHIVEFDFDPSRAREELRELTRERLQRIEDLAYAGII